MLRRCGVDARMARNFARKPSSSTKATVASEWLATYSTCSGASVLYTLIAAPPAWTMPRSAITCSGTLRAMIKPNCPGPKPSERSASVTAATWSRYSRQVSVSQPPSCFQWRAGRSPHLPTASANRVQIVWPETAASMPARSASTSITRNTLLQGGGESLIYVRSHRSVMTRGIAALAWMAAFAGLAVEAFRLPQGAVAGVALALGSAGGAVLAARSGFQLLSWPPARLCLFRDRILLIQGRHEMRAVWMAMGAVMLS